MAEQALAPLPPAAYAVIMAGGNGERFWPLSTPERPKQFVDIFGGKALIRQAVDRIAALFPPERILVITARRFAELTQKTLPMLPAENIIAEPCRRDTAAAVATACGIVLRRGGENAVACILTADQLIEPASVFCETLVTAMQAARTDDAIVTIGIRPDRPETGFGYIEVADGENGTAPSGTVPVRRFVEKPDAETARRYLASGRYLWNAGMFVWRAGVMKAAFASHAADFLPLVEAVAGSADVNATLDRLYPDLRTLSVDFAVMEHADRILVVPSPFTWDDVGSWRAIENHFPADTAGNVTLGTVALRECSGTSAVNADANGHILAVAGLKDVVVVHTPTATLVCAKEALPGLKALVKEIRA